MRPPGRIPSSALKINLKPCQPHIQIGVVEPSAAAVCDSRGVYIENMDIIGHDAEMGVRIPVQAKLDEIGLSPTDDSIVHIHRIVPRRNFLRSPTRPVELKSLEGFYSVPCPILDMVNTGFAGQKVACVAVKAEQ